MSKQYNVVRAKTVPLSSINFVDTDARDKSISKTSLRQHKDTKHQQAPPCVHFTNVLLRTEGCKSCRGAIDVKVFGCDIHGETHLSNKLKGVKSCIGCSDYSFSIPQANRRPVYISTDDLIRDTKLLLERIPNNVSAIIGVSRSGMIPAVTLSTILHVPVLSLDHTSGIITDIGSGWRLQQRNKSTGPLLVVDDTTHSGTALKRTRKALTKNKIKNAMIASIYVYPDSKVVPDIWVRDLYSPHILEWNFANSPVSIHVGFDMDGIICHDDTTGGKPGTPLYLPRRSPAYIITARPERDRRPTERWLAQHGVKIASLVMGPWDVIPGLDDIVDFKRREVLRFAACFADIYKVSKAIKPLFAESCPTQAARISECGVLTFCPTTRETFVPGGWTR